MNDLEPRQAVLVVIGLGSNIEPHENLPRGLAALREAVEVMRVSRVYETEPVAAPGAPVFLNAAILARTLLPFAELKRAFRAIEADLGRVRDPNDKNAPRQIDIDLLTYGDEVVRDAEGAVLAPHPDLERHAYVALPLLDLGGDLVHAVTGEALAAIAARFVGAPGVTPSDLQLAR